MLFGMPTLIEHDTLEETVRLAKRLRLSFVELNMNLPAYAIGSFSARDFLPRDGLFFTLHLDENLNPFDFNPLVADAYTKTALRAVRLADEAHMPVINMHMPQGVHFKLPNEKVYLFDRYADRFMASVARFRDRMDEAIGDRDVTVCVENTVFSGLGQLSNAVDVLLKSPRFMLTYDAGHDYTDGMRAAPFYAARAARVTHMHLNDANEKTCHLPLGAGGVDAEALIRRARDGGMRVVLEIKNETGLIQTVNWLRERDYIA